MIRFVNILLFLGLPVVFLGAIIATSKSLRMLSDTESSQIQGGMYFQVGSFWGFCLGNLKCQWAVANCVNNYPSCPGIEVDSSNPAMKYICSPDENATANCTTGALNQCVSYSDCDDYDIMNVQFCASNLTFQTSSASATCTDQLGSHN